MDIEYRPITADEFDEFARVGRIAFSQEPFPADQPWTFGRAELDRTRAAVVDGEIVGSGRNYSFDLTLPGGAIVPVAGVSWISVLPTHRRRGVLRRMMAALDDEARDHGDAISILTASEGGIYERFGYGVATWRSNIRVDKRHGTLARRLPDAGTLRYVERKDALDGFPAVYARACALRPGMVSRPPEWWEESLFNLAPPTKPSFFVVHENREGDADGFLIYEVQGDYVHGINASNVHVLDLVALTPAVRAVLWQFAFSVDLTESVTAPQLALDEPLRFLLADPRRFRVESVNDHVWLKILDVERALVARRYATTDRAVLQVHDGDSVSTVVLDGGSDGAECRPSAEEPDLVLGIAQLGSIFLGGTRAGQHAAAGTIEERTTGALARVDAMFASYPIPASPTWF
jgi:predicted acetyltransferase